MRRIWDSYQHSAVSCQHEQYRQHGSFMTVSTLIAES
jgi:hypothetical protein